VIIVIIVICVVQIETMNGFWHVCKPASSSSVHAAAMWMSSAACTLEKSSSLESHSLAMPFHGFLPTQAFVAV
jgi:hypothetical protein